MDIIEKISLNNIDYIIYIGKVDFDLLLEMFILPEHIISENINNIKNWDILSKCQILSEEFINKYKELLNMNLISKYQYMTHDFIIKNKKILNLKKLLENQKIIFDINLARRLCIDINPQNMLKINNYVNDIKMIF